MKSIPTTHLFRDFSPQEPLFTPEAPAGNLEAAIKEMLDVYKGSREGGFFTVIGRKPPE